MKTTAISMLIILLALMSISLWKGADIFTLGVRTSTGQLLRFLPVLVIAVLLY